MGGEYESLIVRYHHYVASCLVGEREVENHSSISIGGDEMIFFIGYGLVCFAIGGMVTSILEEKARDKDNWDSNLNINGKK